VEVKLALFDKLHDADRGNHLADRCDTDGIVDRHSSMALWIGEALSEARNLALGIEGNTHFGMNRRRG
jgi:hypothetical protein